MQKKITLQNQPVNYTLKKSRLSKSVRLIIKSDGSLVVTAPKYLPLFLIEGFIHKKSKWLIEKMTHMQSTYIPKPKINKKLELAKYKLQALILVENRLQYFNQFYGFRWNNISIKNSKTRWGSCSKAGNLNFNYQIVLLAPEQSDYIVVHELCHLRQFNHSRDFWALVAQTIPDYKNIRKSIKSKSI